MRRRRRRIWPVLLVLILLLAVGIYTYQRVNSSGLPSPAGADGVANFKVGTHPVIVLNGSNGAINVHVNAVDHVVTLRAVSSADDTNNTAIPYTQSNGTYTFDVSGFSSDTLDLAVPALTDLQVTTTDGSINVNGVSGQMVLSTSNYPITVIGSTLDSSSSLNASNGGLILNNVTFSGGANLVSGNSNVTLTNVKFLGPATISASGATVLAQDTFADTATLNVSDGSITTTGTTFKSTALLSATNGDIPLASTTFASALTITSANAFTTTQTTFQGGATVKASQAMNISATFGQQGTYQFIATDGDIDLTLSSDASFHLDASTNNGSISSDFPAIRVTTDANTNRVQAHGDVGQRGLAGSLKFTLTADNGTVRIHRM